jgi:hypothetical protein
MISPVSVGATNVIQVPQTAGFAAGAASMVSPGTMAPVNVGAVSAGVSATRSLVTPVVTPVTNPLGGLLNNNTPLNNTLNGLNFH